MVVEYKGIELELKAAKDSNTIEGYASIFDNVDSHKDILKPGAFKKTISENFDRMKLMRGHNHLIGKIEHLEEDTKGLYFKGVISDTDVGKETITLIRDGVLKENSIGYKAIKYAYEKDPDDKYGYDPFRILNEVKLLEISVVTWGSNDKAIITGYKSDEEFNKLAIKMDKFAATVKNNKRILMDKDSLISFYNEVKSLLKTVEPAIEATQVERVADINDIKGCIGEVELLIKRL